jgi:hypothetical protein
MFTDCQVGVQLSARELDGRLADLPLLVSPPELHRGYSFPDLGGIPPGLSASMDVPAGAFSATIGGFHRVNPVLE